MPLELSNPRMVRSLNGVDSVRGATQLISEVPEPSWVWPKVPKGCESVHVIQEVATPDQGSSATILTYAVPTLFKFIWQGIVVDTDAGAFSVGAATFTVDVSNPDSPTDLQGWPVQGFIAIPVRLGSFSFGTVWPVPPGRDREFSSLNVIRIKGTNVSMAEGSPNQFVAGLFGYLRPNTDDK